MEKVSMSTDVYFLYGTQEQYDECSVKDPRALYFILDKGRIYKGSVKVADASEGPDLQSYIHDVQLKDSVLTMKVSGGPDMIIDFNDVVTDGKLTNVKYYETYKEGKYAFEPAKDVIVFTLSGDAEPLVVPAGDIIKPYVASTEAKQIKVQVKNNEISASLCITDSQESDGAKVLLINQDGTLISKAPEEFIGRALEDAINAAMQEGGLLLKILANKMNKLPVGNPGELIVSTETEVERSGYTIGKGKMGESGTSETTVATEGAVRDMLSWKAIGDA